MTRPPSPQKMTSLPYSEQVAQGAEGMSQYPIVAIFQWTDDYRNAHTSSEFLREVIADPC